LNPEKKRRKAKVREKRVRRALLKAGMEHPFHTKRGLHPRKSISTQGSKPPRKSKRTSQLNARDISHKKEGRNYASSGKSPLILKKFLVDHFNKLLGNLFRVKPFKAAAEKKGGGEKTARAQTEKNNQESSRG